MKWRKKGRRGGKNLSNCFFIWDLLHFFTRTIPYLGIIRFHFYVKRESMNTQKNKEKEVDTQAVASEQGSHTEATQLDDAADQLKQCTVSLAEWQEKYARLTADFENYKKRTIKERSAWAESAQEKLLSGILTIVDNFDRAMEYKTEVPQELQSWVDGIAMIYSSFGEFLKQVGVKEVPYDLFNPEFHEALLQLDVDGKESGAIVEVMEKGYMLNDRVLRPARVSVVK